ncbi:glycosyltransferase [Seonamhaeicola marinus]|uniref:Glycosyltransferase n=1 Tax=Seonamhaeicola marinus TaxID=1912246 RepID=A0A5D0HJ66_9FLAO|nr:glycosyltransferase [Seonamhaeicola marinus]TYA71433.1 glycosyltransferase [Seonamhaeicola marinus]
MRFLVITNAPTLLQDSKYVAYDPYVREMNIWCKYVDEFTIVSPTRYNAKLLISPFNKQPKVVSVKGLNFTSFSNSIKSVLWTPKILFKVFRACKKADHIHLRCPGNIGLLGCLVQVLFPSKIKTTKYAGNWDPNAKQPFSYRFQKWLLSNRLLTKNMTVLVYGKWKNQSKNIKPFFTATYSKDEIRPSLMRDYSATLNFMFVGSLVEGKRPLLAIKIVQELLKKGISICFNIYGEGILKLELQDYIVKNNLSNNIILQGNKSKEDIKKAIQKAHFLILPSKSEGWPKVIAEAMFFGAIPIATQISCVPFMLDFGKRGVLIEPEYESAVNTILQYLKTKDLKEIALLGENWSKQYTLNAFEFEIKKLIVKK